jgi:hypothetical protein
MGFTAELGQFLFFGQTLRRAQLPERHLRRQLLAKAALAASRVWPRRNSSEIPSFVGLTGAEALRTLPGRGAWLCLNSHQVSRDVEATNSFRA